MDDPTQEDNRPLGVFRKCYCPLMGYSTVIEQHARAAGHMDTEILPQLRGGEAAIAIGALIALPPWDKPMT